VSSSLLTVFKSLLYRILAKLSREKVLYFYNTFREGFGKSHPVD
jgi:hypothetical protein